MHLIPTILALLLLGDAAALRRTDPADLTIAAAVAHVAGARAAATEFDVDPDVLLSIAWHESRYTASAVTAEPGGRRSCGVMTPEPLARCAPGGVLDGYRAGARHLRGWLDAERGDVTRALRGYAGGFRMIARCTRGPVIVTRRGRELDLCDMRAMFLDRADRIRRGRDRRPARPVSSAT